MMKTFRVRKGQKSVSTAVLLKYKLRQATKPIIDTTVPVRISLKTSEKISNFPRGYLEGIY